MRERSETGSHPPDTDTGPLHLDQTRAWLAEWLARGPAAAPFSEAEVRIIQQVSGGDPGRIRQLAAQRCADPAAAAPGRRLPAAGAAALLLAGLALGVWLGLDRSPPAPRVIHVEPPPREDGAEQRFVTTPVDPAVPVTPAVHVAGIRSGAWLRQEDPDQYVLQLISAAEIRTIENYLRHVDMSVQELSLVLTARRGKLWHVLVYGQYPDAGTARRQARRLPDYARLQGPWPRRIGDVMERAVWQAE